MMKLDRRAWALLCIAAVVLSAVAALAVLLWTGGSDAWAGAEPPDPASAAPEQVRDYLASEAFAERPHEERMAYLHAVRESRERIGGMRELFDEMPEEQREQLRENIRGTMRQEFEQRINRYFELPEGPQRTEYLDRHIDETLARRHERAARRDERQVEQRTRPQEVEDDGERERREGDRRPRRGGGFTVDRMRRRLEHSDPEMRAKFMEFLSAVRERMEERGIDPQQFRPGRRGGRPRG